MKYLPLIFAALTRKKTRTILTLLSIIAAFALFGMLDAVRVAFAAPGSMAGIDRLIVGSRFSIIQPLPMSYYQRIRSVPGVTEVAWASWFGGIYQDPKNFFPNIAVSPRRFLDLYPEFVLPPSQRQAFLATRTGAVVGQSLAERFGWHIGERIPLRSPLYQNSSGGDTWTFDLVGIYHSANPDDRGVERQLLFHYDYLDEARQLGQGMVGWYVVKVADPQSAGSIAAAIDRRFENSAYETRTQSEREFQLSFAKQIGDIGLIVSAIMAAVFFTLILLTGNTMAQAFRDRIPELAVLKTIGFTDRSILLLVLTESVALLVIGGSLGLLVARGALPVIAAATGGRINLPLTATTVWTGVALMLATGIVVGLLPALKAMRLSIVDALANR